MKTIAEEVTDSVQAVHKMWGWYLALGILLILCGAYVIYAGGAGTLASVIVIGAAVFVAGLAQLVGAFMSRGAGHVILLLLVGFLDVIVGVMLMQHPDVGALTLTLLLAVLFVFGGIFRFVSALALQYPQYGWAAASGVLSVILGILLWMQWPVSAAWFIGFIVGLNFIFAGISWSTMAVKLKSV